jgi:hypothetical protein
VGERILLVDDRPENLRLLEAVGSTFRIRLPRSMPVGDAGFEPATSAM